VKDADWTARPTGLTLTFGIRGDISSDIKLPSTGGTTRIDIYKGANFNNAICQAAIDCWASGSTGSCKNDSATCMQIDTNGGPLATWNHALQTCWSCGHTPCIPGDIGDGDITRITGKTECGSLTTAQMAALLPTDPLYVCLRDSAKPSPSFTPAYSSLSVHNPGGYLGVCVTGTGSNGDPVFDAACAKYQFASYCNGLQVGEVVDPSSGAQATGTGGNIPANLMDAGLQGQLGTPIRTFHTRVATSSPTGIIQAYQKRIRLGAMTFNNYGSKSECTSSNTSIKYTCEDATNNDAAKIISFIGDPGRCDKSPATSCSSDSDCTGVANDTCNPAGNHLGGLVKSLDDITAKTWTPFAEAYYNAIAYFVKDATVFTPTSDAIQTPLPNGTSTTVFTDSYSNKNPIQYRCQSNNILLISDGASTTDMNSVMTAKVGSSSNFKDANHSDGATTSCGTYYGTPYMHDLSYFAGHRNIFNPTVACFSASGSQLVDSSGNAICQTAQTIKSYVVFNGATSTTSGLTDVCDPKTQMNYTAQGGRTTLNEASNPAQLQDRLATAFAQIASGAASGTAASILSNSEGSGASLLQALFYPEKYFDKTLSTDSQFTSSVWIGELQDFWYYLDPYLQKTSIREDTNSDYKLTLNADKIVQFYFDAAQKKTLINKYTDADGDGSPDSATPDSGGAGVSPDIIKSLWKAGENLWSRTSARTIYTGYNSSSGSTPQLFDKTDTTNFNIDTVQTIMQIPTTRTDGTTALTATERRGLASKLIDYISGTDQAADAGTLCLWSDCKYRSRKITIQSYCSSGTTSDFSACTHEWKLGDIISSTPKLVSPIRLNNYSLKSPTGYNDASYGSFVLSTAYTNRGMAFVGANDGMLHAFKLGVMQELNSSTDPLSKAQLKTSSGSTVAADLKAEVGQEAWAFIPKQVLPYLIYQANQSYGGNAHIYSVDRSPLIVDASIGVPTGCTISGTSDYSNCSKLSDGSTWRTILIGGMGIGGAARSNPTGGSHPLAVNPPVTVGRDSYGYSSYFALDITDPTAPKYLWEFSNPEMGFTTTGPAIVRIATRQKKSDGTVLTTPDHTKNGKWFAVFASGPNGPIQTSSHSFKGQSDQQLRLFIVDLATGALVRQKDLGGTPGDSSGVIDRVGLGLDYSFAGSLATSVIDVDRNSPTADGYYSDDAVYIGYTKLDSSSCTAPTDFNANSETCKWTKGGVIRISTKESTDPATWTVSKVIDNIGPVTTSVAKLQDRGNKNLWLFFGTGRYFYKNDDNFTTSTVQALYGIKDPCYNNSAKLGNYLAPSCTDAVSGTIVDQSGSSAAPATSLSTSAGGWKILLDDKDTTNGYMTERVITDTLANTNGAVFFTTFKPSSDLCNYGGNTLLWAVRYDTGATPPAAAMQGKALMQVSTGAFKEITLSSAFSNPGSTRYDGRRLNTPITSVPPTAQGLSLFSNPPPVKKIIQVQEK
jgi:type IV pilus assembly protein PilY1